MNYGKCKILSKNDLNMFYSLFYRQIGGEVSTDGDFLIFEGNKYSRRGFLFKTFVMSAIVSFMFLCDCLEMQQMFKFLS